MKSFLATDQRRWLFTVAVLILAYYLAARLGLLLAFAATNTSPVWPPSGIALAAVYLLGYRVWPGIAVGAFAANVVVFSANQVAGGEIIALASLAIAVGNSLEALLGTFLLRRLVRPSSPFLVPPDVFKFALIALAMSMAGASFGAASLTFSGIAPTELRWTIWLTWWLGDLGGVLIVAPVFIAWFGERGLSLTPRALVEGAGSLILLVATGVVVFGRPFSPDSPDRLLVYLFIPCLAWAAYRHGPRGVSVASLVATGAAVLGTTQGYGPFSTGSLNDSLIALSSFVVLCTVTGMILATDLAERRRISNAPVAGKDVVVPWLALLFFLGTTVLAWHFVAANTERLARGRLDFLVQNNKSRINERILAYEQVLRGGAGLFAASPLVDRQAWREYIRRLDVQKNFPGIQGIGFAPRITPAEQESHVRQVRAEGFADYAIRPAGERAVYTPVIYLEPFTGGNLRAFGYDMSTEPVRRAAMERARDSGEIAVSGKVTLQQEASDDAQAGFLMYLPVYRNGAPATTAEERRAALRGYVFGAYRTNELMQGILRRESPALRMEIFDGSGMTDTARLHDSAAGAQLQQARPQPRFTSLTELAVGDRTWTLRFTSLPAFEEIVDSQRGQFVLIAGIVLSLLIFILVRTLAVTSQHAVALASDMTVALRESEEKFRSLAESANEAIIVSDVDGRVVSWNRGAEVSFGYTVEEMIGQDMTRLIAVRYREPLRQALARLGASGEGRLVGKMLELSGLTKSGSEFPLELSLSTWQSGAQRFYSGIIRDISARKQVVAQLNDTVHRLHLALTGSQLALFEWNIAGGEVYLTEQWAVMLGEQPRETRTTFTELNELVPLEDRAQLAGHIQAVLKSEVDYYRAEHRVAKRTGEYIWIQSYGQVVARDASGRALRMVGTNADISARKQSEHMLENERRLLTAVLDNIRAGIVVCNSEGVLTLFNRATREFHGLPEQALPAEQWARHYDLYLADGRTPMRQEDIPLFRALQGETVNDVQMVIAARHSGKRRTLLASGQAMYNSRGEKLGAVVAMHDITERSRQESIIRSSLKEKETLLKEVYHRVKNNLQVVTSLLNLQVRSLPEGPARTALKESTGRVRAMALVHEKLYQSDNLSSIAVRAYIDDLCSHLALANSADKRGIILTQAVEPIDIGLEQAVPMGLLLNELITNSFKHGFPDGRKGEVRVNLTQQADATVTLVVSDDGIGLRPDLDLATVSSLGLKLAANLSLQLGGKLLIESGTGARFTIAFPLGEK